VTERDSESRDPELSFSPRDRRGARVPFDLARQLDLALDLEPTRELDAELERLLASPPLPEDVDPAKVSPALADVVRRAALHAIAAAGRVDGEEMALFELLDDLLPRRAAEEPDDAEPDRGARDGDASNHAERDGAERDDTPTYERNVA
jgi:hypothetical protein